MRLAGHALPAIAAALGYADPSGAFYAIKAALKATLQEPAMALRKQENERLDALLLGIFEKACGGDLKALESVLRIMQRRADLNGLDAPKAISFGGDVVLEIKKKIVTGDKPDAQGNAGNQPVPDAESIC